jgi:hypothetical protein
LIDRPISEGLTGTPGHQLLEVLIPALDSVFRIIASGFRESF